MQVLLKESDGVTVGKEWQGSSGKGYVITVADPASSASLANVTGTASSTTLLAANTDRKGFIIFNDSSAILYVKFGATASSSSFTYRLGPFSHLEHLEGVVYTGVVDGIWASATGNARITEL